MSYRVPPTIAWHVAEDESELVVYLMPLPDGDPVALQSVGALVWIAAHEGQDVLATVAEATGEEPEAIRRTIENYLEYLVRTRLLEETEPSHSGHEGPS